MGNDSTYGSIQISSFRGHISRVTLPMEDNCSFARRSNRRIGIISGFRIGIRVRRDRTGLDLNRGIEGIHSGSSIPDTGIGKTHSVPRIGSNRCRSVRQMEIELVGAGRNRSRNSQLLVNSRHRIVRQPTARIRLKLDRIGF